MSVSVCVWLLCRESVFCHCCGRQFCLRVCVLCVVFVFCVFRVCIGGVSVYLCACVR